MVEIYLYYHYKKDDHTPYPIGVGFVFNCCVTSWVVTCPSLLSKLDKDIIVNLGMITKFIIRIDHFTFREGKT